MNDAPQPRTRIASLLGHEGDLSLIRRLVPYARPDVRLFGIALVATPATAALALVQPWLVKQALDRHIVPGELEGLGRIATLYLGAVLAWIVLDVGSTLALSWGGQRTLYRLRNTLYDHCLFLPASFYDREETGSLMTRLTTDVEALGETLTSRVVTIFLDVLVMVGTLVAMLLLEWRLTLLLLLLAPPVAGVVELCRRQLRRLYIRVRTALAETNAFMAERIGGLAVLQLFGKEQAAYRAFRSLNRTYRNATVVSNVWDALLYAFVDGVSALCVALLLWYGSVQLGGEGLLASGTGAVSVGLVVAFIQYLERLFQPLREISGKIAIIQRAVAALDKVFSLLDTGGPHEPRGQQPLPHSRGHLVLRDVRFRYGSDGPWVLRGVDLDLQPGQVVALVGPTGCGKTTLTRLLNRTYDGYGGSITLDGHEVSSLDLGDLRRAVIPVRQDIQLFPASIRFNVTLGDPHISEERLWEALRLVHAHPFVEELPQGLDHPVSPGGANLSVGQGQLLTFARTLAHDAPVVVLDEATASIDSLTEARVQRAIAAILERKTVLVVAHRLSTITAADEILVMEAGEVVERGTHPALLARGGRYAALFEKGFSEARAPEAPSPDP